MRSGIGFGGFSPRPRHHQLLDDSPHACTRRTVTRLDGEAVEGRCHDAGECVDVRIVSQLAGLLTGRFGRDSILVGMTPSQGKSFSGTKIAFTRIPDVDEFLE